MENVRNNQNISDVYQLAVKYVIKMAQKSPSIQGQNGNGALYRASAAVRYGFDLDVPVCVEILEAYFNPACVPAWDVADIERTVNQVDKTWKQSDGKPRGHLRDGKADNGGLNQPITPKPVSSLDNSVSISAPEKGKNSHVWFTIEHEYPGRKEAMYLKKHVINGNGKENRFDFRCKFSPGGAYEPVRRWGNKRERVWLYDDVNSEPKYLIHRMDNVNGKRIFIYSWNPETSKYESGINGGRVPYLLDGRWIEKAPCIVVVEGEKCVSELTGFIKVNSVYGGLDYPDIVVTTTGSSNLWGDNLADRFAGKDVLILSDNDDNGRGYVEKVIRSVFPLARSVRAVRAWPGRKTGFDIADYIAPETGLNGEAIYRQWGKISDLTASPIDKLIEVLQIGGIVETVEPGKVESPVYSACDSGECVKTLAKQAVKPCESVKRAVSSLDNPVSKKQETTKLITSGNVVEQGPSLVIEKLLIRGVPGLVYYKSRWYKYNGVNWREFDKDDCETYIYRLLCSLTGGDIDAGKADKVFLTLQRRLSVPTYAKDGLDPSIYLDWNPETMFFDSKCATGWVVCRNCILNIKAVSEALYRGEKIPEWSIIENSPRWFCFGCIPCNFDLSAECPRWEQFVREVCINPLIPNDMIGCENLRRVFGLSLTYDRSLNCFALVYGEPGAGKSVALEILKTLNTGSVCSVPVSNLGKDFDNYPLTENRLNLVMDMQATYEGGYWADQSESALKSMTGGESISVSRKYENKRLMPIVSFSVFGSNHIPYFRDKTGAINDRFRLIQFYNVFRGTNKQDPDLIVRLKGELSGILNWALWGYGEIVCKKMKTLPESEEAVTIKAISRKISNPIIDFVENHIERFPGETVEAGISSDDMFGCYKWYCIQTEIKPKPKNQFITEVVSELKYKNKQGMSTTDRDTSGARKRGFCGYRLVHWTNSSA